MASPFTSPRAILAAFSRLPAALFNGIDEIVRLDSLGRLPAIDGSQLLNIGGTVAAPTFGVGGTYATAYAAIADGQYNIRCIGDAVETQDIIITQTANIEIEPGAEWNLGASRIAFGASNIDLIIKGSAPLAGVIKWAPTISGSMINGNGYTGVQAAIADVKIDQSAAVAACPIMAADITGAMLFSGSVEILLPNNQGCGIQAGASQKVHSTGIITLKRVGSGTNCFNVLSGAANISLLVLDGDFKAGSVTAAIGAGIVRQLICKSTGNDFSINLSGSLAGASVAGGGLNINITGNGASLNQCALSGGSLAAGGYSYLSFLSVTSAGSLDMSSALCGNVTVDNCRFDGSITIGGNDNRIVSSAFFGGYTNNGQRNARIGVVDAIGGLAITDAGTF